MDAERRPEGWRVLHSRRARIVAIALLVIAVATPVVALSRRNGGQSSASPPVDMQIRPGGDPLVDSPTDPVPSAPAVPQGQLGESASYDPSISADGWWVAFASNSSNLVENDTNQVPDVFLKDRSTGRTSRVSVSSTGRQANGSSSDPALSADGRFIAFTSLASSLVPGDTNRCTHRYNSRPDPCPDVFVHDRVTHKTVRVSVSSRGAQANGASDGGVAISADGRFVAFGSEATNLVRSDTNGTTDVFLHDRRTGAAARVSIASDGRQLTGHSFHPSISHDGSRIVFLTEASKLDPRADAACPATNHRWPCHDVLLRDVKGHRTTTLVKTSVDREGAAISGNGRYVAFTSPAGNLVRGDTNGKADNFVYDTAQRSFTRVSVSSTEKQGNGDSLGRPAITADGRYVVFSTRASNLVRGDKQLCEQLDDGTRYSCWDILLRDREAGTTEAVSVMTNGTQADWNSYDPAVSAGARQIAFASEASNMTSTPPGGCAEYYCPNVFVRDRARATTKPVSVASPGAMTMSDGGGSYDPAVSQDGSVVAFTASFAKFVAGDTNGTDDIFVWRRGRAFVRVSVSSSGREANGSSATPAVAADGNVIAFVSAATNLVADDTNGQRDIFVFDRSLYRTERVTVSSAGLQANAPSWNPRLSADGRYVLFTSDATNLVPGDTNAAQDVFLYDRARGRMRRVSVASGGGQANAHSGEGTISADGKRVAFTSAASNLFPGDTGECLNRPNRKDKPRSTCVDILVRDLEAKTTTVASVNDDGQLSNGDSDGPSISGNGRYVAFSSGANNLTVRQDARTVYIRDLDGETIVSTRHSAYLGDMAGPSGAPDLSFDGRILRLSGPVGGDGFLTLLDRSTGEAFKVSNCSPSAAGHLASGGRYFLWATGCQYRGDANGVEDVFMVDRLTGEKTWISRPNTSSTTDTS